MTALPMKESGWSVTWLAKPSGEITFFYKYSLAVQIFFDIQVSVPAPKANQTYSGPNPADDF